MSTSIIDTIWRVCRRICGSIAVFVTDAIEVLAGDVDDIDITDSIWSRGRPLGRTTVLSPTPTYPVRGFNSILERMEEDVATNLLREEVYPWGELVGASSTLEGGVGVEYVGDTLSLTRDVEEHDLPLTEVGGDAPTHTIGELPHDPPLTDLVVDGDDNLDLLPELEIASTILSTTLPHIPPIDLFASLPSSSSLSSMISSTSTASSSPKSTTSTITQSYKAMASFRQMEDPEMLDGADDGGTTTPIPLEVVRPLKVATYSFGEGHDRDTKPSDIAEDIISLAEELIATEAEIIAIQGVARAATDALIRTMRSKGYTHTKFDNSGSREGVEYMFAKVPVMKREFKLFVGSRQGRGIGVYHIDIGSPSNPTPVIVCTSQFEAGGSGGGLRKSQLTELQTLFVGAKRIVFAGDTNIPAWQSFDPPVGWMDAWREKGSSDTEKTTLHDRMDRVYYRGLRCVHFDTVCETGCGLDDDGFARRGVVATFVEGE